MRIGGSYRLSQNVTRTVTHHCRQNDCRPAVTWAVASVLRKPCPTPVAAGSRVGLYPSDFLRNGFQLEGFSKEVTNTGNILHVYLEGDGLPWLTEDRVSADPTPRNPLMLRLMALDRSPSLYLGRPCYNGHAQDEGCSPLLWTHRRYAPEVLSAMADALAGFLREYGYFQLVFIGHSGGGTLALLLAQRFSTTRAVVSLAGNADIDVWADLHGYSRLQGSLNPANVPGGEYPEFHYLGERDESIPPQVFQPVLKKRVNSQIIIIPEADHVCCWDAIWPVILNNVP